MLEYNPIQIQDDANVRIECNPIWNDANISSNESICILIKVLGCFWKMILITCVGDKSKCNACTVHL